MGGARLGAAGAHAQAQQACSCGSTAAGAPSSAAAGMAAGSAGDCCCHLAACCPAAQALLVLIVCCLPVHIHLQTSNYPMDAYAMDPGGDVFQLLKINFDAVRWAGALGGARAGRVQPIALTLR